MHHPRIENRLLAQLDPDDYALLHAGFTMLELPYRQRLAEAGQPIEHVYFLSDGVASAVTGIRHETPIEIGLVGHEGLVNLSAVLGVDRSPTETYMQSVGHGARLDVGHLRDAMVRSPTLTRVLLLSVHVFMVQAASTILANGRASLEERLARWLLMAHDRIEGNVLLLTHELLAIMLGVRRAGVTVALKAFERRAVITRRRGCIIILDRRGLIELANGYYGVAESELERVFPPRPAYNSRCA